MTVWHQGGGGPALVTVEVQGVKVGDDFGRVETDAWGTADTGQPWTVTGGAADDYLVNGTVAAHFLDSVNVPRHSIIGGNWGDVDVTVNQIFDGVVPVGAPIQVGLVARWSDSSNHYFARLFLLDTDTVLINLVAIVGGAEVATTSNVAVAGLTASSTRIAMRLQVTGPLLRARAWNNTGPQPITWPVELTHSGLTAGQVGIRSTLQPGNTNTLPVIFTFDGFRTSTPQWTTVRPLHVAGMDVDMAGRQSELDRVDNAALQLVVQNRDGDYTPGSTQAPYPLTQGQQIRVKETIGRRSFDLIVATLQQPEAVYGEHPNDAVVTVAAVDLFAELAQNGRTFISTLGEWIRYHGGDSLVGYWPMNDRSGATQCEPGKPGQGPLTISRRTDFGGYNAPVGSLVSFGATPGPSMDDITCVELNPLRSATLPLSRDWLVQRALADVSITGSEAVAFSLWYLPSPDFTGTWDDQALVVRDNAFTTSFTIQTALNVWICFAQTNAGIQQINGPAVIAGKWELLTVHLNVATGLASFWIGQQEFTANLGGASTGALNSILVDATTDGSAACHLQIYAGDLAVVNRQLHLAQYAQGVDPYIGGLRFQRTDERFATACAYAGISGAQADYGTVWMQKAELAGKTVADVIGEAVRTEQGRAFISGAGVPTFHSRIRTRYNV